MQIKSLPAIERPVEKTCRYGIKALSNAELFALILHTGTKNKSAIGLAEDVLAIYPDGVSGFGNCELEDLLKIEGIGKTKACSILAAVELGKRIASTPSGDRICLSGSEDVANLLMEELRYAKKEYFKSILVNTKGELITIDDVSVGELSSTIVHPREVFVSAVRKSAAAVIFVHNHPSGDPTPSREDVQTTKRLIDSGEILGIRVLDHIIIGNGKFSSLRDMKMM